jgi:hypothetical protein
MKNVNIAHCGDCPHRCQRHNELCCELMEHETSENDGIPQIAHCQRART